MSNKQNDTLDLNQTLRSLIKETPVSFENRDKLAKLGIAISSNNDFIKRTTIKKYGN